MRSSEGRPRPRNAFAARWSLESRQDGGSTCAAAYDQCGGEGWTGSTCCQDGSTCQWQDDGYSQCWVSETDSSTDDGSDDTSSTTLDLGLSSAALDAGNLTSTLSSDLASSISATAAGVLTTSYISATTSAVVSAPTSAESSTTSSKSTGSSSSHVGEYVGIAIGMVVAIAALVLGFLWYQKRRRQEKQVKSRQTWTQQPWKSPEQHRSSWEWDTPSQRGPSPSFVDPNASMHRRRPTVDETGDSSFALRPVSTAMTDRTLSIYSDTGSMFEADTTRDPLPAAPTFFSLSDTPRSP